MARKPSIGHRLIWQSNKGREREVLVRATMLQEQQAIVEIRRGLPGEKGSHRKVPYHRLLQVPNKA